MLPLPTRLLPHRVSSLLFYIFYPVPIKNTILEKLIREFFSSSPSDNWLITAMVLMLQLRVSMRYLRDVLQMRFPQLRARAAAAEAEARAREVRLSRCLLPRQKVLLFYST